MHIYTHARIYVRMCVFETKSEFGFAGNSECCGVFKYVKLEKVMCVLAFFKNVFMN
jgi:hypothetical protein